jgi:hypothetical protein
VSGCRLQNPLCCAGPAHPARASPTRASVWSDPNLDHVLPAQVAVPHLVINGFKNVLAIALGTEYSFPQADKVRNYACSSVDVGTRNAVWSDSATVVITPCASEAQGMALRTLPGLALTSCILSRELRLAAHLP